LHPDGGFGAFELRLVLGDLRPEHLIVERGQKLTLIDAVALVHQHLRDA